MIYPKSVVVTQKCIRYSTIHGRVIVKRSVLCGRRNGGRLCTAIDVWPRRGTESDKEQSQDTRVFERILQYRLFYGGEHESNIRGIGSLCQTVKVSMYSNAG